MARGCGGRYLGLEGEEVAADWGGLQGEGLRGWKTWTGLIWLRISRISGLLLAR